MTLSDALRYFRSRFGGADAGRPKPTPREGILDHYVSGLPRAQNAVDAIPGWNHAFPPALGLQAGPAHLYDDARIRWCIAEMGGDLTGRRVLELGPLEGMHTAMLVAAGAQVDAVEANTLAFMRCLVTREILGYANAKFWLGDFMAWLAERDDRYDLIVASGVLYHMEEPIRLLELMAARADAIFLWTHVYADGLKDDPLRGVAFSGQTTEREIGGERFTLFERSYYAAWRDPKFCGGPLDRHYWMRAADILKVLDLLGFDAATAHVEDAHPNGPAFSVFARRRHAS